MVANDKRALGDEILADFVHGDPKAFREVEKLARRTVQMTSARVPPQWQEEVTLQTVLHVYNRASQKGFRLEHSLSAFVRMVTTRTCIDRYRKERRRVSLDGGDADAVSRRRQDETDPGLDPLAELLGNEENERLHAIIRRASEPCREILHLRFFLELPFAEIGARLGRPEKTLRVTLHRCVRWMRIQLERQARSHQ